MKKKEKIQLLYEKKKQLPSVSAGRIIMKKQTNIRPVECFGKVPD